MPDCPLHRRPIAIALLSALIATSLCAPAPARAGGPPVAYLTHYLCRRARPAHPPRDGAVPRFAPIRGVTAIDRFSSIDPSDPHTIDIAKPDGLCKPVLVYNSPLDPDTYLESYRARPSHTRPKPADFVPRTESVVTAFGTLTLDVIAPAGLLVSSSVEPGESARSAPSGAPWRCYDVAKPTAPVQHQLSVFDERWLSLDVGAPQRLCVPANQDGAHPDAPARTDAFVCHRARLSRTRRKQSAPAPSTVTTHNLLGAGLVRRGTILELCMPATLPSGTPASACPLPTATPTPTPTVAPTADRATLESLSLSPPLIARLPGESKHFSATGHFPGGLMQDLSQEVTFTSSDPAVAVAPNASGDRNRIDLLSKGTTIISATDPLTGVTSAASGGDATLIATGPLQYITTSPVQDVVDLCESVQYTATGHYEDGVVRNLTQDVIWSTDDPSVARATNPVGQRSRIDGLAPGLTYVRARDPVTGMVSLDCCWPIQTSRLYVGGALVGIFLEATPDDRAFSPARAPDPRRVSAVAVFTGGARRVVTEDVVFQSSDESVVQTPNQAGDRGKLLTVGSGTASITATDPATGISTPSKSLRVLDGLISVSIPLYDNPHPVVDVGYGIYFTVSGEFPDGSAILHDVRLVSSDPTIADAAPGSSVVVGHKAGFVTISAVDIPTGISSTASGGDVTLAVRGPVQRIILTPKTTRRLLGQKEAYLVQVFYEGGFTEPITFRTTLTSADPTIGKAEGFTWNDGNAVTAVGSGTTTISAFDPVTGLTTTASGDDATFTVLKPLARIIVTPHGATRLSGRSYFYGAIGRDTDGAEINLTQDVTWTTSDPSIALATNTLDERSRIDTLAPGEGTITATESLSGVSSTQGGPDATLTVIGPLKKLVLTSELVSFQSGQEWQLTATGKTQGGEGANLTQEVDYTSNDPAVVLIAPDAEHRSRIVAVAPGSATISAKDPVTGITSTASGGDIVITVTP